MLPTLRGVAGDSKRGCNTGNPATAGKLGGSGEPSLSTALSDTKRHQVWRAWRAWRACLAGRLLALTALDRAVPGGPVMYGTGKAERVTRGILPLACVTQGTGEARTSDVHHWMALNDDMGNG